MKEIKSIIHAVWQFCWGAIGGAYLLLLYAITIFYAVFLLSAIQVRENIRDEIRGDFIVNFKEVLSSKNRFDEKEQQLYSTIMNPATSVDQKIYTYQYDLRLLAEATNKHLSPTDDFEPDNFDYFSFLRSAVYLKAASDCSAQHTGAPTTSSEICALIADIKKTQNFLTPLYDQQEKEINAKPYDVRASEYSKGLDALYKNEPLASHVETYRWFEELDQEFLLTTPSPILILLLTIAMGALGSAVTMTWSYVRADEGLTARRFIVLPFVGCMSAFIIYIFINAGQMTLTTGAGESNLNAFALSFIGIISGLLSERAYIRISDVGNTFFRAKEGQVRWANGLQRAMEDASITIEQLSKHLELANGEVSRIVEQSAPATHDQQKLIAAFVRRPARDIFTDMPPEGYELEMVAVPQLVGLNQGSAQAAIIKANLVTGQITKEFNEESAAGLVLRQIPEAGRKVQSMTSIDLTISAGSETT